MHPQFLSNTYLVAAEPGGEAFFVDAGGPMEPLFEAVERARPDADARPAHPPPLRPRLRGRRRSSSAGPTPRSSSTRSSATGRDRDRHDGARRRRSAPAASTCRPSTSPGTPRGCSASSSRATSSPATRCSRTRSAASARPGRRPTPTSSPRSWTRSWRCRRRRVIRPGHTDATTVGEEFENNKFIRVWRGLDAEGDEPVHRARRARDAGPARRRLRRRPQGLGPLARRARRHRARQQGRAASA